MEDRLLEMTEVAQLLGTTADRAHALRKAGLLKCMKLGHIKCRYSTLMKFIETWDGYDVTDPTNIKELGLND